MYVYPRGVCKGAGGLQFRSVRIAAWSITGDYKSRRIDVSALTGGAVVEVCRHTAASFIYLLLPALKFASMLARTISIGDNRIL